jgi:hypothetical protein
VILQALTPFTSLEGIDSSTRDSIVITQIHHTISMKHIRECKSTSSEGIYRGFTGSQISTINLPSGCCLGSFNDIS